MCQRPNTDTTLIRSRQNRVRHVLTACPSCYKIFKSHGGALTVQMVYEVLSLENMPAPDGPPEALTIHDPCVLRFEAPIQSAVRSMAARLGYTIEEMPHQGTTTFCCGEGASVSCTAPDLADTWGRRRAEEARGRPMLTYCVGCDTVLVQPGHVNYVYISMFTILTLKHLFSPLFYVRLPIQTVPLYAS